MEPSSIHPNIGDRLLIGSHAATVRYIGPVAGQDGTWVGLEWDDASRGKNDGSHDGVRYFECVRPSKTAASFVRLTKLMALADTGLPLEDAIQTRYKTSSTDDSKHESAYARTVSNAKVAITLVGEEAATHTAAVDGSLKQASFVGMRISSLDPTPIVVRFLSRVGVLDISSNLIPRWSSVTVLIAVLPELHTLILSNNILDFDTCSGFEAIGIEMSGSFPSITQTSIPYQTMSHIRTLVLNACALTWPQAVAVARTLPSLQALHLCGNGLITLAGGGSSVEELATAFNALETLDLDDNNITNWTDVAWLSRLPKLRILYLSNNALTTIQPPSHRGEFETLETLMLGGNLIHSWHSVDALDKFPSLREVRLSDNPLTAGDPPSSRYEIIARVGALKSLNGAEISAAERWDAELAYLRHITDQAAQPSSAIVNSYSVDLKGEGVEQHPRHAALVAKYGQLTASGPQGQQQGMSLSASMVELVLVADGGREIRKRVPSTITVGRLKPLLERLLGVKVSHQSITLVGSEGSMVMEDVTREDGRELRYFEVRDGWRVEVGRRDPQDVGLAKEAAVQEQQRRMEAHEEGLQRLRAEEERLMAR